MWPGCGRFACRPVAILHADYQIKPDIVKVHLAGTAWYRSVALNAQTDCNPADVGQVDFLIGKHLQVDNPFSPSVNRC